MGAVAGAIGWHHGEIAQLGEMICRPGDAAGAAPGLMGQPCPVRLAPARAGVHGGEQRGVGDVARGGRKPAVGSDTSAQPGAGVSIYHGVDRGPVTTSPFAAAAATP